MHHTKLVLSLVAMAWVSSVAAAPVVVDRSQGGAGGKPVSIEDRLARIERVLESRTLIELTMRLDNLQREVETLRGETEEQIHQVKNIKQRQRDLYLDIDGRLRQLETGGGQSPNDYSATQEESFSDGASEQFSEAATLVGDTSAQAATEGQSPAEAAKSASSEAPLSSRDSYRLAFDTLKAGKYEEAVSQFRLFVEKFPKSSFADNAQYWIGEAMYALHRFDDALVEFNKIIQLYPKSAKIADAMLKMGYSHYEKADYPAARETLEKLRKDYAKSSAASLAEKRLEAMKLDGH